MEVPAGTFMVILGENGSGKTTLFNCLLGLQSHEGEVDFFCSSGQFPDRTGIFAVFDASSLYPRWSVRDNINYQINDGKGYLKREVKELVPEGLLKKRAVELSTGQRKLVMLSTALASEAPVLLLDEFSNGLDRAARDVVRTSLARACAAGRIIIATGHDLSVFDGLANRVGILREGRLLQADNMTATINDLEEFYESHLR